MKTKRMKQRNIRWNDAADVLLPKIGGMARATRNHFILFLLVWFDREENKKMKKFDFST